ncbi:hypothetical protein AWC22_02105 [Mycobacterium riyadhense]|uniref:Uncharacterized protein n=1 Tax=Mycobacterium riyadhense TaxID=486698 RepID=A0A1X2BQS1_9MYCO|nr:hypothetical protein AWC22_02105 [Mycobacterium riyadhense]
MPARRAEQPVYVNHRNVTIFKITRFRWRFGEQNEPKLLLRHNREQGLVQGSFLERVVVVCRYDMNIDTRTPQQYREFEYLADQRRPHCNIA